MSELEKRLELALKWLREKSNHSMFCRWEREAGRYWLDPHCTCGRDDAITAVADAVEAIGKARRSKAGEEKELAECDSGR